MRSFLLIFLIFTIQAFSENKVLTAVSDLYPPLVDPKSPKEGLALEIVRAAFKTQGYKVDMHYDIWPESLNSVKNGKYDILVNTWFTKDRTNYLVYSDPYLFNRIKFIKRKDYPFEYKGISSLTGKKIGVVKGYGYSEDFNKADNFVRIEEENMLINFKKLIKGEIDLTLEDEIVARVRMAQEDPDMIKSVEFVEQSLSKRGNYVTCGKINPNHKKIINAFNVGLDIIKSNGIYDEIVSKYNLR